MIAEQKTELSLADLDAIHRVVTGLQEAWNNADGEDFGQWFQDDAEFVNVYGMYAQGRSQIAEGHKMIFHTVYAGSILRTVPVNVRLLSGDVALVHMQCHLSVPLGPRAGEHDAIPSMVLARDAGAWKIAAFHNTFIKMPNQN
jgi:uncharacterized protein (TIGR02246 family)